MGCLSRTEREEFLKKFWEAQEQLQRAFLRHRDRVWEAAEAAEDPYRRRLLVWAAENWGAMEVLGYEDSPGLFGTAYAALPEDLKADMEKMRPSAGPNRELTVEEREGIELQQLRYEERERTGSPCPETEVRLKEIHRKRGQQGLHRMTTGQIMKEHQRIAEVSRVHDPKDLPR